MKYGHVRKRLTALMAVGILVSSNLFGSLAFAAETESSPSVGVTEESSYSGEESLPALEPGTDEGGEGPTEPSLEAESSQETLNFLNTVSGNHIEDSSKTQEDLIFSQDFEATETGNCPENFVLSQLGSAEISVVENNGNKVLYLDQGKENEKDPTVKIPFSNTVEKAVLSYSVAAKSAKGVFYLPTFYAGSSRLGKVTFNQNSGMKLSYKEDTDIWGMEIAPLTWYTVKITYEKGKEMSLAVNGEVITENLSYSQDTAGANQIGMSLYRLETGAFFLDNLKVTVEDHEPVVPASLVDTGSGQEEGDISYSQNFDSVSEGKLPDGWVVSGEEDTTQVGVEIQEQTDKALVIHHPSYQNSSMTVRYVLGNEASKGVLKYRVKAESTSGALYLPSFYSDTYQLVKLAMNGGKFQKAAGSGWADIMDFQAGKWYEIEMVLDTEKEVFDLYIDGSLVLAQEPQSKTDVGKINRLALGVYKQTTNTYTIDDIEVTPYVKAQSARFGETQYTVGKGQTLQLGLIFTPENASLRTASWSSLDPSVAEVDSLGRVTGIKEGTVTVTAAPLEEGVAPVTVSVTVDNTRPESIKVEPDKLDVPQGSYYFITPTVLPENAVNKAVRFESENPEIAQVDFYGEVYAKGQGTTNILVVSEEDETIRTKVPVAVNPRLVMKKIYVSPSGNDNNDGSEQNPVRTFEKARQLVGDINDSMTGDIEVIFAEGYYPQTSSIKMTEADSGTNGYFVRYIHEGDGEAVIGGEHQIQNWSIYDADQNIYVADAQGIETRQMFVNNVRAVRARSQGGLNNGSQLKEGNDFIGFTSDNMEFLTYRHPEDLEFVFKQNWTNPRCQVAEVAQEAGKVRIVMDQPGWTYCADKGMTSATVPVYYENALELLHEPGEWYLDTHEGKIYYMPRSWENMDTARITVPILEELLTVEGTDYDHMVRNIEFCGLTFADTTWNRPSTQNGHADSQNNHIREHGKPDRLPDAAVTVKRANTVLFTDCTFTRLGISALKMVEGVQNSTVSGCKFYDISGSAINVGDPYTNDPDNYNPTDWRKMMKNNDILNNYIHDIAVDYMSAAAVSVGFADYMDMKYNEIFDIPYSAFHIGYGWAKRFENVQRNMHIEYNFVHDLMGDGIFDGGAFYFNGNSGGTEDNYNILANNYVRNQMDLNAPLYTDEGTTYWRFENNVVDLSESGKWHGNADPRWMLVYVPTIEHIHVKNIYTSTSNKSINQDAPDVTFENIQVVSDNNWPAQARAIMEESGLQAEYASLRDGQAERINADEEEISIGVGEETSFEITVTDGKDRPVSLADSAVYYESSDPEVVFVDNGGKIQGKKVGTAQVKASVVSGNILKEIEIKVYVGDEFSQIKLEDFEDGRVSVAMDSKGISLVPAGLSNLGRVVKLEKVTWGVEDTDVAKIDEKGFLTPVKPGKTQILAEAYAEGKTVAASFPLTVEEKAEFIPDDVAEFFETTNKAFWNIQGGAVEMVQGESVQAVALNGFAYYTGQKYKNELFTFDLTVDANGKGGWPSIMLRSQDSSRYVSGGASGYIICMGSGGLELHRFNDSKRTVIYGTMEGYESVGGDLIVPNPITHGENHKIEVGALTEGNGVRLLLKVDDQVVFDFLDESEDAITESGYFGLVGRGETFTLGKRVVEIPVNTEELTKLIQEAEKKIKSDYTPESWALFSEALQAAKGVLANPQSQEQVDQTKEELEKRMKELVKAEEPSQGGGEQESSDTDEENGQEESDPGETDGADDQPQNGSQEGGPGRGSSDEKGTAAQETLKDNGTDPGNTSVVQDQGKVDTGDGTTLWILGVVAISVIGICLTVCLRMREYKKD